MGGRQEADAAGAAVTAGAEDGTGRCRLEDDGQEEPEETTELTDGRTRQKRRETEGDGGRRRQTTVTVAAATLLVEVAHRTLRKTAGISTENGDGVPAEEGLAGVTRRVRSHQITERARMF